MAFRRRNAPEEMTEEQRLYHEQYVKELNAQNKRTVRKVGIVLWIMAMIGWTIFIVLDFVFAVGVAKTLFHCVGAALTAVMALVGCVSAKKKDADTEA